MIILLNYNYLKGLLISELQNQMKLNKVYIFQIF